MSEPSKPTERIKDDFMATCLKDHDQETCERMWEEAKKIPKSDAEIIDLTLMLAKAQVQRDQATELLRQRDAEQKMKDDAEKAVLIVKISQDNKLFNRRVLSNPHFSLRLLRRLDNILALYKHDATGHESQVIAEDSSGKIKMGLTVGEWDSEKGEWKT